MYTTITISTIFFFVFLFLFVFLLLFWLLPLRGLNFFFLSLFLVNLPPYQVSSSSITSLLSRHPFIFFQFPYSNLSEGRSILCFCLFISHYNVYFDKYLIFFSSFHFVFFIPSNDCESENILILEKKRKQEPRKLRLKRKEERDVSSTLDGAL
jgi:hypothetical protein